jgi:AraC-like DNA-binding protein
MELIENGQAEQFTLEALAAKCGFSNRNTFTSAFKKFSGKTPSCFIKKIG